MDLDKVDVVRLNVLSVDFYYCHGVIIDAEVVILFACHLQKAETVTFVLLDHVGGGWGAFQTIIASSPVDEDRIGPDLSWQLNRGVVVPVWRGLVQTLTLDVCTHQSISVIIVESIVDKVTLRQMQQPKHKPLSKS